MNIEILKNKLSGSELKRTLDACGSNKYRVHKGTGIAYRTLCYWQNGAKPSDDNARLVGEFLGLISGKETLDELKAKAEDLRAKSDELLKKIDKIESPA